VAGYLNGMSLSLFCRKDYIGSVSVALIHQGGEAQCEKFFPSFFRRSTLAVACFCKNFAIKMANLLRLGKKKK
jgi:hypothetical protein